MKIIASINKTDCVRFVSHLDLQRMLQRTIRRADIPVAYSQGFNPHPLISFATALAVGQTGECEWVEIRLEKDMSPDDFKTLMNKNLPEGFSINNAYLAKEGDPSLATQMVFAEYEVHSDDEFDKERIKAAIEDMLQGEIIVKKHKKQNGRKLIDAEVDIRPMIFEISVQDTEKAGIDIYIKGRQDAAGGLNVELLMRALNEKLSTDILWRIHRKHVQLEIK